MSLSEFHSRISSLTVVVLSVFSTGLLQEGRAEEKSKKVVMRDAPTHDVLAQRLREAKMNAPVQVFKPAKPIGELEKPNGNLIEQSDVLCYNGQATLIPKRAILNLPENLKSRLGWKEGSKVMTWKQFQAANANWISTYEVSFEQAKGEESFDELQMRLMSRSPKLVVATYQEGPISVLPQKTNPAEAEQ